MKQRVSTGLVALAGALVALTGCGREPSACNRVAGVLASHELVLRATCDRRTEPALVTLEAALAAIGPRETFGGAVIDFEDGALPHVTARARRLVIDPSRRPATDVTVWLHELGHLSAAPSDERATTLVASRLLRSIEEGLADYYAASISRSSRVGEVDGRQVRDLAAPPSLTSSDWALLPFRRAPFDEHRFGLALAGALYDRYGFDAPLARRMLRALAALPTPSAAADRTPRELLESLAEVASPEDDRLYTTLESWLPPEWRTSS